MRVAALQAETSVAKRSYTIRISSSTPARSVYLSFGDLNVHLSDNYFDLLPGEPAEIHAESRVSLEQP